MKSLHGLIDDFCNAAIAKEAPSIPTKEDHRLHKVMSVSYAAIMRFGDEGREAFISLLRHESDSVKSWVAAQLLTEKNKEAQNVLRALSKKSGSIGFNATMTLQEFANGRLGSPFGKHGK